MYKKAIYTLRSNERLTPAVWRMTLEGDTQWITAPGQFVNETGMAGYTGQNHFSVTYGDQKVTVRAEDGYAALFTAAKHWGYKFTRPEYHQNARATKLHYTPDTRPGAVV